jgi:tetratricopeptide (TPR) repeat protein
VDSYGERPELRTLRDRIEEIKLREAEARARDLGEQARSLFDAGELDAALERLQEAQEADPRSPALADLLARIEEALRQRSEEQERARELAAAMAEIEAALERARDLAAQEDFQGALKELRCAADLAPDHTGVRTLTQEVETAQRWREQEKRHAEELARAAAALEVHLGRGELTDASRLFEKTVAAHGDRGPIPELRHRLETLRAERTLAAQPSPPLEALQPKPEPTLRRAPETEEEEEEIEEASPEPPAEVPNIAASPPQPELQPETLPMPASSLATSPAGLSPSPVRWRLWATVAAGTLLLVLTGLFLGRPRDNSAPAVEQERPAPQASPRQQTVPAIVPSPSPPQEAAPVAQGVLVIDALPWAEVVRLENENGDSIEVGSNRYTPLTVSLPVGSYQIVLKNPRSSQEKTVSAVVAADGRSGSGTVLVVFNRINAEDYFHDLGF